MKETIELTTMTETELKALFYDEMFRKDQAERNMRLINQELVKRQQPAPTEEAADEQTDIAPEV